MGKDNIAPTQRTWVFDPDSGGKKIPERVKRAVRQTIEQAAEKHFKGKYTRLDIRFRGRFCYIARNYSAPLPGD